MVLSDNVGYILAGHFTPLTSAEVEVVMKIKDTSGVLDNFKIYSGSGNRWNVNSVHAVRIGKGTTPASHQDFDLEVPFVNPPESGKVTSSSPTYLADSGIGNQATQFSPMGASDSLTEVTEEIICKATGGTDHDIQLSRIIIDPAVAFLINQQVDLDHEVNF